MKKEKLITLIASIVSIVVILCIFKISKERDSITASYQQLEDKRFATALTKCKNSHINQIKIDKTNSYIEVSITYIQEHDILFAIMKDITERVSYDEKLDKVKFETLAITDDVIKKQMRVAREIASLLGETTAETKVALVNLKKALTDGEN